MVDNDVSAVQPRSAEGVWCRKCGLETESIRRTGPFGFQKRQCVQCGHASVLPLSSGWRLFWWTLAIITAVSLVSANVTLYQGYSWIPGGLGVVAFVVLFTDVGLRNRVSDEALARATNGAADVSERGSNSRSVALVRVAPSYVAVLTSLAVCAVIASGLGAAVVGGLNNGYDVEVLLKEAEPASSSASFDGTFDLQTGDAICGNGDDYFGCIEAHRAMYNTVCTGSGGWRAYIEPVSLTSTAQSTCEQLLEFVKDGQNQLRGCGSGCTTQADSDGLWGYTYLHPVPHKTVQETAAEQPAVTYTDRCWFSLGPIELGRCERSGTEAAQ